ncbi:hypothetical protein [Granulicoccus phenolivorans]|uniref:hypothetical protein n=1 Tax=Granulicoccus phenolivorans TaxID=266854 RepID=UPI00041628EF|nr:hypothetical protein [Granulicoccus phenolivorans]
MSTDLQLGVNLPISAGQERSSSAYGRAVVAAALAPVDPVGAAAVGREKNWRHGYPLHLRRLVEAGLSAADGVRIAEAGLATARERAVRVGHGLDRPLTQPAEPLVPLALGQWRGTAEPETELSLPLHGRRLRGEELRAQLATWQRAGVLEPGAVAAVTEVLAHPEWLSLPGYRMVALGAAAEMGPVRSLLRWGATVIGVDLPGAPLWDRLEEVARRSAGTLQYPLQPDQTPGADLLTQTAELREWLPQQVAPGERLVLGNYAYADGVLNLRLALATDLLFTELAAELPDLAGAWLATPTDAFAVPGEVVRASAQAYAQTSWKRLRAVAKTVSAGRLLQRNYHPDEDPGIADAIIPQQGPNYLLAKRLHRWRATVARRAGQQVSLLVAPPTRTRSVTRNRALAAAYAGAHRFGVTVFEPATANTLMAALLVYELMAPRSTPDPGVARKQEEVAPWQEEAERAVAGGLWRGPYDPRSALGIALVLGWGAAR